jgi:hypothetical protein
MKTTTDRPTIATVTDVPQLAELRAELSRCHTDSSPYLEQYRRDFETRFCLWQGQSADGRRWQSHYGKQTKVRPWDGASDVRTFTADDIINEQVETMLSAFARATIQVTALRATELDWSSKVTVLLQWLIRNQLAPEIAAELEKAAQWRQTYGLSIMGVWWRQEWRLAKVLRKLEDLWQQAVESGDAAAIEAVQSIADPLRDEQSIAAIVARSPVVDRQGARRILRELREKGESEVPMVTVHKNQPCWEALRPFLDVFFPVETADLQRARWMMRRRVLTLAELEVKKASREWDPDWCEEVYHTRGKSFGAIADYRTASGTLLGTEHLLGYGTRQAGAGQLPGEHYVEVYSAYYQGIDQRSGIPVLMHTVFSPLVGEEDSYGRHEPFTYAHGAMPFVPLVRERVESALADSRSVPEIAATFQGTIKRHRDGLNDLGQMSLQPPLLVPLWRAGQTTDASPCAHIPYKNGDEFKYLLPPPHAATNAQNAEEQAEMALARYFGLRRGDMVDPTRTQLANERLVQGFLGEVGEVTKQMMQLWQQYGSPVTTERVVGRLRIPFHVAREEIQGQFDLTFRFDPVNLNQELAIKRLEAFQKFVLAFDNMGVVNRQKLAELGARALDPYWADEIVGDPALAAQSEAEDEMKNLGLIATGTEPPMRPEGQNYQLRLSTLLQGLQDNPWQRQRIESQPDSLAMLQARIKHLNTMAEQYGINKDIGRTGAEPGLVKLREEQGQRPQMMEV